MTGLWRTLLFYASAILVGAALGYWLHSPPAPAPSVRVAQHESRVAHAVTVQRETTYVRDTLRLTHTLTRWDTARVTQTLTHDSIVYVPRDVADSVVRACRDLLNSCAALHAADSAEIHALHAEIAARAAAVPSRLGLSVAGLYDPIRKQPSGRAEADVALTKHLSFMADAERGLGLTDSLRAHVGARWTF